MKKAIKKTALILIISSLMVSCVARFDKRILYDKDGNVYQLRRGSWQLNDALNGKNGFQYKVDSLGKVAHPTK
jgi:hypothetical protein